MLLHSPSFPVHTPQNLPKKVVKKKSCICKPQEMFPFSNSDNSMSLEPLFKKSSFQLHDQNPLSKHHDDSPFFSNFPSPFFDEHELPLNQIFPQYHFKSANPCVQTSDPTKIKQSPKLTSASKLKQKTDDQDLPLRAAAPRKRTGKKDRHSKICTAQGIRDRRMRLSLQVARKFFDLQDLLGYDKASKTIEWLFNKSKKAIRALEKEIIRSGNNFSKSESECEEVVSGIEENSKEGGGAAADHDTEHGGDKIACKPNMRESREKARARARCRTEEKMMGKRIDDHPLHWCKSCPNRKISDLDKLGSSSTPFDGDDQERVSAYAAADYSPIVHQPSDVGTIEKLLGNSSSDYHCPAAVCIDSNTNFMGFLGNWDLLSNDRLNYAVTSNNIQASMPGNSNSIYSAATPDFPLFHQ